MRLVVASRHGQSSRLPPPPMAFLWSCCLRCKLSDATAAGWLCALRCSASPPLGSLWLAVLTLCSQDTAANAPKVIFTHDTATKSAATGVEEGSVAVSAQGFTRKMSDGSVALVLLNRQDKGSLTLAATWAQLGLTAGDTSSAAACAVRDLINLRDLPTLARNSSFSATVDSHAASFVRIKC